MGRRLRASVSRSSARSGRAYVSQRIGGKGWSLPQARDLVRQGYTAEHASKTTGFPASMLRARGHQQSKRKKD